MIGRFILNAALLALTQGPILALFLWQLWARPHYEFFPLLFLVVIGLTWRRLRFEAVEQGPRWAALALYGVWALMLALAYWLLSPWLGYLAFLIGVAGFCLDAGGSRLLRSAAPALFLLLLFLPPPFNLEQRALLRLQSSTTDLCSKVLDWFEVTHYQAGHLIEIPGKKLFVEEACSGVNSLVAIVALSICWAVYWRRPAPHVAALALAAALIVFFVNVIRVSAGVFLMAHWEIDILQGSAHQAVGMAAFAASLLLTASFDQFLTLFGRLKPPAHLLEYLTERTPADATMLPQSGTPRRELASAGAAVLPKEEKGMLAFSGKGLTASMLVLLALQLLAAALRLSAGESVVESRRPLAPLAMPQQVAGWKLLHRQTQKREQYSLHGEFGQSWLFERGGLRAVVSLAHPFSGWHDISLCYRGQGWTKDAEEPAMAAPGSAPLRFVRVRLVKHDAAGCLRFGHLSESGVWLEPEAEGLLDRIWSRLAAQGRPRLSETSFQVQTFVETPLPLTATEQQQTEELFLAAARLLEQQIIAQKDRN